MNQARTYEDGIKEGQSRAIQAIEDVSLQNPVQHHMRETTYEDKGAREMQEDCVRAVRGMDVRPAE